MNEDNIIKIIEQSHQDYMDGKPVDMDEAFRYLNEKYNTDEINVRLVL